MDNVIKCCGDCRICEPLKQGLADPSVCASQWGFVHIVSMYREMRVLHKEIMDKLNNLSNNKETPQIIGELPISEIETKSE